MGKKYRPRKRERVQVRPAQPPTEAVASALTESSYIEILSQISPGTILTVLPPGGSVSLFIHGAPPVFFPPSILSQLVFAIFIELGSWRGASDRSRDGACLRQYSSTSFWRAGEGKRKSPAKLARQRSSLSSILHLLYACSSNNTDPEATKFL